MPSQFFGLNISYTGLQAANAALNTTANNISNVETEGYSRQRAVQEATPALHTWTSYGMAGTGVDTIEITQVRNQYYDIKYWDNNCNSGTYDTLQYYMKQIEDYFTETDTKEGFGSIYSDMFTSLEEVYKSSGDDTVKTQFLSSAQSLCDYFQSMSISLQKIQQDANTEIKNKADEINSIASQIATLNKQINTIEITGSHANELRDQRALLIDDLSKIVSVSVKEVPIYVSEDSTEKSGINTFYVDIAGGQSLVYGYDYNSLELTVREGRVNQSDVDGIYELKWNTGLEFNLYGKNLGGELQGLVKIRDGNNEEYFHGTSAATAGTGDYKGTTYNTVKVSVTEAYLKDMNKSTLHENGTITLANRDYNYVGWSFDATAGEYTFYIKDTVDPQYLGGTADIGREIDYQGVPYYMEQMNEWVRVFAEQMNEIEKSAQDEYGNAAEIMFSAMNLIDGKNEYKFSDYTKGQTSWGSDQDNYTWLTAASFQVNRNMIADVKKMGTTSDIHQGRDAQDISERLLNVQNEKGIRGCTSKEFLQTILSDVALSASSANTFSAVYTDISKAITNQRLSEAGVDNDEEALELVKFQEAYNLSAKMIQIFTEIYDRLILQTGV